MTTTTTIFVKFTFVGWHHWPSAPPERAYLSLMHRHLFGVTITMGVEHDDREVEFHDLMDIAKQIVTARKQTPSKEDNPYADWSCEHHAGYLLTILTSRFPNRAISVTVDEDGECGATVTNKP